MAASSSLYGTSDENVAAAMNAAAMNAAAELQAGIRLNAPATPPPQQPPGQPPPGYGEYAPFNAFDNDGGLRLPGQDGGAPSRPADPMAQMMLMLTNLIKALPEGMAAAVNANSNHRMANVKLEVNNFARIKTFTNKAETWKEWRNQFFYVIQE